MLPPLSRQNIIALATAIWIILVGGVRVFAWDSLKDGFIDVRPLPRVPRFLTLVGLVLVFVFIGSIFFNDPLRWSGSLQVQPLESSAARGLSVPSTAVPIAYIAIILAWTFLLTGALHVRPAVRWVILFCFFVFGLPGLLGGSLQAAAFGDPVFLAALIATAALAVLGLLIAFILLPRFHLSLAFEFTLILLLVGGLFIHALFTAAAVSKASSINFVSGYLVSETILGTRLLIIPFLYLAGAETMNFGISLTRWGTRSAERYARGWIIPALLFGILLIRWLDIVWNQLLGGISQTQLLAWGGALLTAIAFIPIALWRARYPFGDRVPLKLTVGLIFVAVLPQLALIVSLSIFTFVLLSIAADSSAVTTMNRFADTAGILSNWLGDSLYLIMSLAGLVTALIALRWKRYTVAAYGMILAWTQLLLFLMKAGGPLEALTFHYQQLDLLILIALTALTLYWWSRRELTPQRMLTLLALVVFGWVLNFIDFLDNPLALFLGFAGIFFTVFGILWSVLTAGGKFANFNSIQFPRLNRIILYLGYVLLTLNLTHWYTVTHNIEQTSLNTAITLTGLRIFGFAAAYLVFVEGGRTLFKKED